MNKSIIFRGLGIFLCFTLLIGCLSLGVVAEGAEYTVTLLNKLGEQTITHSVTNAEYILPYCEFTPLLGTKFGGWLVNGEMKNPGDAISLFSDITISPLWKMIDDTLTIELKNHSYISNYPDLQLFGLEMLSDKGLLVVDQELLGYRNQQGKLLFTFVEETAEVILQEDLTEADNLVYELPSYEREAFLNEFGIDLPKVKLIVCPEQTKEPEKELVLILRNGININDFTPLEYNIFYAFDIKGIMRVSQIGDGYWVTDPTDRLLFTINSQGIVTLSTSVTAYDNMEYTLTTEDKIDDFVGVAKISLQFNTIIYGDVNGDRNIDAKDALEVLKAAVGKTTLTEKQKEAAEVDGKEGINAGDALQILRFSVNKITQFPIETK